MGRKIEPQRSTLNLAPFPYCTPGQSLCIVDAVVGLLVSESCNSCRTPTLHLEDSDAFFLKRPMIHWTYRFSVTVLHGDCWRDHRGGRGGGKKGRCSRVKTHQFGNAVTRPSRLCRFHIWSEMTCTSRALSLMWCSSSNVNSAGRHSLFLCRLKGHFIKCG